MRTQKLAYIGGASLLVAGLVASSAFVFADDLNKHDKDAKNAGTTLEVHVWDNGKALVRGAKVTAVSGNNISAETVWGSAKVNWTVKTGSSTEFIKKGSGNSSLSDVKVGNIVSFTGNVDANSGAFTVDAKVVKNWSHAAPVKTTIQGKVKSTSFPGSFILSSGSRDYTVKVSSSTSILNRIWLSMPIANIKADDNVRVYGSVHSDNTVDATVIRNLSIW